MAKFQPHSKFSERVVLYLAALGALTLASCSSRRAELTPISLAGPWQVAAADTNAGYPRLFREASIPICWLLSGFL